MSVVIREPNFGAEFVLGEELRHWVLSVQSTSRLFSETLTTFWAKKKFFSWGEERPLNNLKINDFVGVRNMIICKIRFRHKQIDQATCLSLERKTRNQVDYVLIDQKHISNDLNVRILRGLQHRPGPPSSCRWKYASASALWCIWWKGPGITWCHVDSPVIA